MHESYPRILRINKNETFVLNRTISNTFGDIDLMLTKIDSTGAPVWSHNYGNTGRNYSKDFYEYNDGFLILGWHAGHNKIDDWILINTDLNGNVKNYKVYGDPSYDEEVHFADELSNGFIAILGSIRDPYTYPVISFLDSNLNVISTKHYYSNNEHLVRGMTSDVNDNLYVSGTYNSKPFILSTDLDGNLRFMKYLDIQGFSELRHIIMADNESFITVGFTSHNSSEICDILALKMNNIGEVHWVKKYIGARDDKAFDIDKCDDGSFIISCESNSFDSHYDGLILNIDKEGIILASDRYDIPGDQHFTFSDIDEECNIVFCSESNYENHNDGEISVLEVYNKTKSCNSIAISNLITESLPSQCVNINPMIFTNDISETSQIINSNKWSPYHSIICLDEEDDIPPNEDSITTPPVDTVTIDHKCNVYITNVLTPNSDGIGDYVAATSSGDISNFEITVHSLGGILLFHSFELVFKWDGGVNGSTLPNGVYIYNIKYYCHSSKRTHYDWGKIVITR